MNNWFYAHDGEQKGPVSQEELARLVTTRDFIPTQDLVWREGMTDWKKATEVPELNLTPSTSTNDSTNTIETSPRSATINDPYQAPSTPSAHGNPISSDDLPEIEPGSTQLGITECIGRSFELLKRYFGIIIAAWAIYFAISIGISLIVSLVQNLAVSIAGSTTYDSRGYPYNGGHQVSVLNIATQIITNLISSLISIFFTMGLARIGLNLSSGKPVEVTQIFGEGGKLLKGFVAYILYSLMVGLGLLLLIAPGVYLAAKYCHYQNAIVDKNMGILESFHYSASPTQNNKWAVIGLAILLFLINLGGALALCVGLIFTVPLTWLAWLISYRWLQHGPEALNDRGLLRL